MDACRFTNIEDHISDKHKADQKQHKTPGSKPGNDSLKLKYNKNMLLKSYSSIKDWLKKKKKHTHTHTEKT